MIDLVIVIQGKLHEHSLRNLGVYKKYGKVILSCDDTDNLSPIDSYDNLDVTIVVDKPRKAPSTYNQQNVYFQTFSTLVGVRAAMNFDPKWILKVRSDHSIGRLEPFLEELERSPDCYVCSNLHFRPDNIFKFHASDKFIAMSAHNMLSTFELTEERLHRDAILLESGIYDYTFKDSTVPYSWYIPGAPSTTTPEMCPTIGVPCQLPYGYVGMYPEVVLATSFLLSKGIRPDRTTSRQQMQENFRIIKMLDCAPFLDKTGSKVPLHNWVECHNISEL